MGAWQDGEGEGARMNDRDETFYRNAVSEEANNDAEGTANQIWTILP